jgi:TatD DNase family protein
LTLDQQVAQAKAVGIDRIVQCGCDLESARWTAEEAVTNPAVLGAISIHPNDAPRLAAHGDYAAALAQIHQLAKAQPRVRAIGETGLDYYRTGPEGRAMQQQAFRDHIALAKELGLALQIHDREAHRDVREVLLAEGAPGRTVFHCFSGDAEMAAVCGDNGWYCSFAGTVTFGNAADLRAAVQVLPVELVLLETDAPYLTPQPYRGRANAPFLAPLTMRTLAELMGLDLAGACQQISDNSVAVYGDW